jgi:hypothetical protein
MPQLNRDELTKIIRDTLYATVGVGVLTVQQLDQARRQLAERLSTHYGVGKHQVDQLIAIVEDQMGNLDARMKVLERQLDGLLDPCRAAARAGGRRSPRLARPGPGPAGATEAGEKFTTFVRDAAA